MKCYITAMDSTARSHETRFKIGLVFLVTVMAAFGAAGLWFTAEWTKNKTISGIQKQARQHLELYRIYLTSKIAGFSIYPKILAENSQIIHFCGNPVNAGEINSYLAQFNASAGESVSYILNKDGVGIASSDWDTTQSSVGKNYAFRPYYTKAISGVPAGYVAIGLTSRSPGYYASYPIKKDGEVIGVAVVKSKLDSLRLGAEKIMGTLLITDDHGIIFSSNDDMFNFYTIQKLHEDVLSKIKENKQYQGVDIEPLPITSETAINGAKIITIDPKLTLSRDLRYVIDRVNIEENGWGVYLLTEVKELDKKIFVNMTTAFAIILVLIIAILLLINVRLRQTRRNFIKHQKELEHLVEERTQELHEINERMLVELIERRRLENALKIKTDELVQINENLRELVQKEVSEHDKKEQMLIQQSRMAAMGEMIGVIAHQWKQPLNAIGLLVQDLEEAFRLGEMDELYLKTEVQATMHHIGFLSQTIDDFKNFLKPSKEKLTFDVKQAVEEIMSMFDGIIKKDWVMMSLEASEGTYLATGYPNEFKHVILNIINNARDAIVSLRKKGLSEKAVEGTITILLEKVADCMVIVTISDNGGGIPEDIIGKIFEPYFTSKSEDAGTGIGLYMSKTIIENNMGGSLSVRNIAGGAEFTIEI